MMWVKEGNGLKCVSDETRQYFRTSISKDLLEELQKLAEENNTFVNYLLENGLENLLQNGSITYNKKNRPKDRIQYGTRFDKELLKRVREFAKSHKLFLNDVIEYSVKFIDLNTIKHKDYRNRVVDK